MDENIEILKELKFELEKILEQPHLKYNKVEKMQEIVDKVIAKKKIQIKALDKCIQRLEDLYE